MSLTSSREVCGCAGLAGGGGCAGSEGSTVGVVVDAGADDPARFDVRLPDWASAVAAEKIIRAQATHKPGTSRHNAKALFVRRIRFDLQLNPS